MAKYCPKENRKVIYLYCMECEDKVCRNPENGTEANSHNRQSSELNVLISEESPKHSFLKKLEHKKNQQ